jgi:hypothetical protein
MTDGPEMRLIKTPPTRRLHYSPRHRLQWCIACMVHRRIACIASSLLIILSFSHHAPPQRKKKK